MTGDPNRELETWWQGLSDEQRAELLPLGEGDLLLSGHPAGLTAAPGLGPAGTKWETALDGYAFPVDRRVADFLETKRERS